MDSNLRSSAFILGLFLFCGLVFLGYFGGQRMLAVKMLDRTVTVKGLAERKVNADTAIWPISFRDTDNNLESLYMNIRHKNLIIINFLKNKGFSRDEISISAPSVTDRQAENHSPQNSQYRYTGQSTVSVYSIKVKLVLEGMETVGQLGNEGIVISGKNYEKPTQFLFTKLNEIKPEMIEEATRNARLSAEKFANDSMSSLGKIKTARQGLFSIENRDSNTLHIKKVRVVSTIQYYLSD